jgi:hypothetical protein
MRTHKAQRHLMKRRLFFRRWSTVSNHIKNKKPLTEKIGKSHGKSLHVPKLYKIHRTLTEDYLLLNASHALAALGAKEYKIGRLLIRCFNGERTPLEKLAQNNLLAAKPKPLRGSSATRTRDCPNVI